jgi:hypothetical protein
LNLWFRYLQSIFHVIYCLSLCTKFRCLIEPTNTTKISIQRMKIIPSKYKNVWQLWQRLIQFKYNSVWLYPVCVCIEGMYIMFTSYQVIILADMCDKTHHETIGPNNQRLAITARSKAKLILIRPLYWYVMLWDIWRNSMTGLLQVMTL